ncbi:uncharacterized protein LOC115005661 isoform X2 [Cottoperca gobio]|uniref:E3 ubiquitin-protein ligase Topors n=1 Tax=Cottoperca gobio TaxID=56716 RepID=A0A6J2PDW3_COTGO|nr:uncharacterized protein LOC115005661 isoform X2 [Cottoperca gobio]
MPLTVRNSARRRRKTPDKKERPGESTSSAQVMAPTRMKLRVRRRDNAVAGAAAGDGQPEEEEERSRESGGRRRKNTSDTASTAAPATSSSSSPPPASSSASASARAVMAAEEASPDSKCPICLDRFNNLAYLDRCLHRFCFPCIQEWSHNKAECPLCKQPFASILHSVRAEDDFKEYTLRPAPANSSVAATVAMVAAMASAARSDHQMRLMLRRHRGADAGEGRRRRRERGGRGGGGRRSGVWEWYLDSPHLAPLPHHAAVSPVVAADSEDGEDVEEQRVRGGADLAERGVIFEGLTGLGGAVAPVAPNDRATRRLMTRLVARQRLQREGGAVRRLRERETVAFRRALYRSGIRVRGVAGANGNANQQQRNITAESFRRSPTHLNRLRPWLRRELTVLYGAHGSLVDIVQRIIMARLARHGLEDTPTIEEELRPFLLARTDHFLHELVSFARSPLSLENYDLQAVYEPPAALELDGTSSSSDGSSVIAISEGEEEERPAGGRSEERLATQDDIIQAGSCLSLATWDDETPGPSYSSAEPPCSLTSPPFSPEEGREKREEEECLIVGYKKPIAERTPELVQLSSDTEEEEEEEKKKEEEEETAERLPPLASAAPPLSYLPTIPPSTSGACRDKQEDASKQKDGEVGEHRSRSWSGSSGGSRNSVCTLSPATPGESERRERDRKSGSEAERERRKKKRRRRRERSGTLYNPNRSIYPAMMRHRSHSPSPFHSSVESGSPLPPSPPESSWEFHCSRVSPLTSSRSSSSSSSLQPSTAPSLSPNNHGEKPGGKRKYKSRHLDSDDKDPTWRPGSSREETGETERRKGRDDGRRRERRSREERSPSVEIIYEGTVPCNATHTPARKRRRKRQRKTTHSSSPVIITLDSDSSHSSSSSSRLSSQQTVDFSDLPPLPLVHSAGVGGALSSEIGELPVDILDRGSDGSEAEPAGPVAINSDVDVENVDEGGSALGSDDDKGPNGAADAETTESNAAPATKNPSRKRNSTSDSRLLASILSDLKGITAPKFNPLNFEPNCSPGGRKRLFRDGDIVDQNLSFDSPTRRNAIRPPPPLERLKDKDVPPLLKQASPVRSYNRNTPPPLKHKDAGSPHPSPISPIDLHLLHADAVAVNSDLNSNPPTGNRAIPPISVLKKHFTGALAARGEPASTSCISLIDHPSAAPPAPPAVHSRCSHGSGQSSTGAGSHLEFNYFHSSKLQTAETSSCPADVHPARTSQETPAHTGTLSPTFCRVSAADLRGEDVFSGVNCHNKPLPVCVSSIDLHSSQRLPPLSDERPPGDPHSSSVASEGPTDSKASLLVDHGVGSPHGRPPPVDVHCSGREPPANARSPSSVSIHTAFSCDTFPTSRSGESKLPLIPDSKPHNHVDSGRDFLLPADNHISSSRRSANTWNSQRSDSHPAT